MKISYNWLQSYFKEKLPPSDKLAELLTMHSFEVESVEHLGHDTLYEIDILPNRAHDCLSHFGIAREASVLTGLKLTDAFSGPIPVMRGAKTNLSVSVEDPKLCERYMAVSLKNVRIGPSPAWLVERLGAVGQKSINNIVDILNYVMLSTGQPMHAFDADTVRGGKIIVRKAKEGERLTTLDERGLTLTRDDIVIADSEKVLGLAGIKGGKDSGVVAGKTRNLILEAAHFNSVYIRKSSRRHGILTDAAKRFENQFALRTADFAMAEAVRLILEHAGTKEMEAGKPVEHYPKKQKSVTIIVPAERFAHVLGVPLKAKDVLSIGKRLFFNPKEKGGKVTFVVPFWRLDVNIPEDVIEEVGRIYGFAKILSVLPEADVTSPIRNTSYFYAEKMRDILTGAGFDEVYNYSFASSGAVEVANPLADDRKFLRENLAGGLEKNLEHNLKYFDEVRVFELGTVFEAPLKERVVLGLALGYAHSKKKTPGDIFYELKGAVSLLFRELGIVFEIRDDGAILSKGASIGAFNLAAQTVELDFDALVKHAALDRPYVSISKFPSIIRDVALFVPTETKAGEVLDTARQAAGHLLVDIKIFDIFQKPARPDDAGHSGRSDKKSIAFRMTFNSSERTLTDDEANSANDSVVRALQKNSGWEVRA